MSVYTFKPDRYSSHVKIINYIKSLSNKNLKSEFDITFFISLIIVPMVLDSLNAGIVTTTFIRQQKGKLFKYLSIVQNRGNYGFFDDNIIFCLYLRAWVFYNQICKRIREFSGKNPYEDWTWIRIFDITRVML